ncbi:MAG: acyl carrier protein [Candidatus Sulfotelmatobacter sp.]
MTSAEIEQIIIQTLAELQAGCEEPGREITPATTPLGDLGFFDSLLAIETTLALEQKLKCKCPHDNAFVEKDSEKLLTIAQIAVRLAKIQGKAA